MTFYFMVVGVLHILAVPKCVTVCVYVCVCVCMCVCVRARARVCHVLAVYTDTMSVPRVLAQIDISIYLVLIDLLVCVDYIW